MRPDRKRIFGWIVVAIGFLFFIDALFSGFNVWRFVLNLWPLILVVLGIYLIINRGRFTGETSEGRRINKFIGEMKPELEGQEIGDLNVSLFIGELHVDLAGARLASGDNHLDISLGIGEASITIPAEIKINVSSQILAGELNCEGRESSGVLPGLEYADEGFESSEDRLYIRMEGFLGRMSIEKASS